MNKEMMTTNGRSGENFLNCLSDNVDNLSKKDVDTHTSAIM